MSEKKTRYLPTYSDTELIEYLEGLLKAGQYTGRCIVRQSIRGRGFRLHESSRPNSYPTIREALSVALYRKKLIEPL